MPNIMAVMLNGIAQLEYDRDKLLPDHQAAYLDRMDEKMKGGILLGDETISNPDLDQRTRFAAGNLVHALKTGDESVAAAMCSYLAIRLPELKQVLIEDHGEQVSIEFIYDREYRTQVAVDFSPRH